MIFPRDDPCFSVGEGGGQEKKSNHSPRGRKGDFSPLFFFLALMGYSFREGAERRENRGRPFEPTPCRERRTALFIVVAGFIRGWRKKKGSFRKCRTRGLIEEGLRRDSVWWNCVWEDEKTRRSGVLWIFIIGTRILIHTRAGERHFRTIFFSARFLYEFNNLGYTSNWIFIKLLVTTLKSKNEFIRFLLKELRLKIQF